MIKHAFIVVGANYGDEGKGLLTDYLSSLHDSSIVIRHNGGSQAGHTVVTSDSQRFVFGHIGSGSFCGKPTFLGPDFITNPMLFRKELKAFLDVPGRIRPQVIASSKSIITTPFDMLANQLIERSRGDERHGSCGTGIYETVTRSLWPDYTISCKDIQTGEIVEKALAVKDHYFPQRMKEAGLKIPDIDLMALYWDFLISSERFKNDVSIVDDIDILKQYEILIFEGAQGLLLDRNNATDYPHITPSHTGLYNPRCLLNSLGHKGASTAYYITRFYMTRHGNGPMNKEFRCKESISSRVGDNTNLHNEWQGSLRFAPLDLDRLKDSIRIERTNFPEILFHKICLTCMDQADEEIPVVYKGMIHHVPKYVFKEYVEHHTETVCEFVSYGPTRRTMKRRLPLFDTTVLS